MKHIMSNSFPSPASSDRVSIDAHLACLAVCSEKAPIEAKYKIAFRVFDVDDDGEVSADDLFHVWKKVLHATISDAQLEIMVAYALRDVGNSSDATRRLDYRQFKRVLGSCEINHLFF